MRRVLALAGLAVALIACGDATGPTSVTGTWNLQTINGQSLPFTIDTFTVGSTYYKYEITGISANIASNGTYSLVTNERDTAGTNVTVASHTSSGTWSQSGSTLTFTDATDSTTDTATLSGSILTFVETSVDPQTNATVTYTLRFTH